jgi:hypothetical protein
MVWLDEVQRDVMSYREMLFDWRAAAVEHEVDHD